jgi:hypothetical protein
MAARSVAFMVVAMYAASVAGRELLSPAGSYKEVRLLLLQRKGQHKCRRDQPTGSSLVPTGAFKKDDYFDGCKLLLGSA